MREPLRRSNRSKTVGLPLRSRQHRPGRRLRLCVGQHYWVENTSRLASHLCALSCVHLGEPRHSALRCRTADDIQMREEPVTHAWLASIAHDRLGQELPARKDHCRLNEEKKMKVESSLLILGAVLCGCVSNSPPPSRATTVVVPPSSGTTTVVVPRDSGNAPLCRDGTRPPCY
jgi:hypothetical protein